MIGSTPNNTKEQVNVNTSAIQMMNRDGFIPSTLVLGFWNDLVSIKLHPALDASKQTETRFYDYEQWVITALTSDKVQSLVTAIEERILPAIRNGEERNASVIVNKDCLVLISSGTKDSNPYMGIYKEIDPTTKKPKQFICYEFKTSKLVIDYDAETGACDTIDDNISEFLLFLGFLKSYLSANSNAVTHTMRYVNKFFNDKMMSGINALMNKAGIVSEFASNKRNTKQTVFGNSNTNITPVPVSEVDDLEAYMT